MRLTADVIVHARAGINPCDERELDLRGYKIPMIENLGVTQDQFDAIDFSDNEIKKLDNFPRYKRLSSLLLCNNHVSRIATDLGHQLPNLSCLILTNNKLSSLGDLEGLGTCKKLTILSLLHNEVVNKQYYRLYVINLVPSLKQLDFQKVTLKEREAAGRLARSQAGKAMRQDVAQEVEKAKTFTPGKPAGEEQKLTDEHRAIYAERIARATTVEEVEMLSRKIQAGIIPSATYKQAGGAGPGVANGSAASSAEAAEGGGMALGDRAPGSAAGQVDGQGEEDGDKEVGSKDDKSSGMASVKQASEVSSTAAVPPTETDATREAGAEVEAAKPSSAPPASEKIGDNDEMMDDANPAPAGPPAPTPEAVAATHGASGEGEREAEMAMEAVEAEAGVKTGAEAKAASVLPATSSMDVDGGGGETAGDGNGAVDEAAPEDGGDASRTGAGDGDSDAMAVENGNGDGQEEQEDAGATVDAAAAATAGGVETGVVAEASVAGEALEDGREDEGEKSTQVADGAADMEQEEDGGGEEAKLSEAQIKKFKVAELKKELVELQLPTNGLKAALQARLLAAMGYTD